MKFILLFTLLFCPSGTSARIVSVADYPALHSACQKALPKDTIIITPGVYSIEGNNRIMVTDRPGPVLVTGATSDLHDVIIQGVSMDSDIVEMIFNLDNSPQWTFQNFTARNAYYHAFKFDRGSTDCTIRNVAMLDNGESGVKGTSDNIARVYPDRLLVENCKIGYTKPAGSAHPQVEGIDGVGQNDWVIRDNLFVNVQKSEFDKAAYAVFTKGNSSGTIIERNRFENCFIGASFGGGGTDPIYFRDGDTTYEHRGGIVRNNIFIRCTDAAIYINKGKDCKIYNNTLLQCVLTIQLRYKESNGEVKNNLILLSSLNAPEPFIRLRDGATLTGEAANRFAGGQEFVNIIGPIGGFDASLRELSGAIDSGVPVVEVTSDFIGTARPQGKAYDIGAFEYIFPNSVAGERISADLFRVIYGDGRPRIEVQLALQMKFELNIIDELGRVRAEFRPDYPTPRHTFEISASLRPGLYFAVLRSEATLSSIKIIIQ